VFVLLEFAFDFLLSLIIEVLLKCTGELLRFVFTLGRRKPTLQFWRRDQRPRLPELISASSLLGFLFWLAVLLCFMA
jgi:hypothetical protein